MGCDIHAWAEYRESPDGPWVLLRDPKCSYCRGKGKLRRDGRSTDACFFCDSKGSDAWRIKQEEGDDGGPARTYAMGGHPYVSRNYWLFATLSGVRRYSDFDETMGADFEPIAHEGAPADLSPEMAEEFDDPDGHSPGWITFSEIEAAFITMLDPSQGDLATLLMGRSERSSRDEDAGTGYLRGFWDGCVELNLRPLADKHGGENVRLIFYYDN